MSGTTSANGQSMPSSRLSETNTTSTPTAVVVRLLAAMAVHVISVVSLWNRLFYLQGISGTEPMLSSMIEPKSVVAYFRVCRLCESDHAQAGFTHPDRPTPRFGFGLERKRRHRLRPAPFPCLESLHNVDRFHGVALRVDRHHAPLHPQVLRRRDIDQK